MCGRFALNLNHDQIRGVPGYHVHVRGWRNRQRFHPRVNIAPHSHAPVIRRRRPGTAREEVSEDTALSRTDEEVDADEGQRVETDGVTTTEAEAEATAADGDEQERRPEDLIIETMKWGLVPHWSKTDDRSLNTTNARSENMLESSGGMWSSIKGRKRCAVPVLGYYEWLTKGKDKFPHFTKHKEPNKIMLLAGLYDVAHIEGSDEPLVSFTIVTTAACKAFEWLHERQPVILSTEEKLNAWLDTSSQTWDGKNMKSLLEPFSDEANPLECYAVPKEVGSVRNENPNFILPLAGRKDGIQAMFSKQKEAQVSSPQKGKPEESKDFRSPPKVDGKKRKRSDSPILVNDNNAPQDEVGVEPSSAKRAKETKEGLMSPKSPPPSSSPSKKKTFATPKSTPTKTKGKAKAETPSKGGDAPKITNFFGAKR